MSIRLGKPIVGDGLEVDVVRLGLKKAEPMFKACFTAKADSNKSSFTTTVDLRFRIEPSGEVRRASADREGALVFGDCLVSEARKLRFSPFDGDRAIPVFTKIVFGWAD